MQSSWEGDSTGTNETFGLPQDQSQPPEGVNSDFLSSITQPVIKGLDEAWSSTKSATSDFLDDAEMVIENAPTDIVNGTKAVYNTGVSGAKQVVTDVTDIAEKPLSTLFWYGVIALVVVGGVIYYAGKSGALKTHVVI